MSADPFDRSTDVSHGVPVPVAPGVCRVVAANPSPMTFTGTATYLVGERDLAIIDPGPDDPAHVAAVLAAVPPGGRVRAILVTHSHRDHSGAVPAMRAATGAPVWAFGPHGEGRSPGMAILAADAALGGGEGADTGFAPDRRLREGEVVEGEGWRLLALHTPGHLSNHLSFALDGTGILFTGDTVMGWNTTLVSPPDGDMAAFMASLRRLQTRRDALFLPGHGNPVRDPQAMLAWQIAHREGREASILAALADGAADAAALARRIYVGLEPRLLPAAARNVLAHLLALEDAGRVRRLGPLSASAPFALADQPG
jgi:glyoxylase-like metal-dependent hydrolase (beta-lactamase superfamily II)